MILDKIDKLLKSKETALLIPTVGSLVWIASFVLLLEEPKTNLGTMEVAIRNVLSFISIFTPLMSILGIIAGGRYISDNGFSFAAAFGVALNIIWILIFLFFLWLLFGGISA